MKFTKMFRALGSIIVIATLLLYGETQSSLIAYANDDGSGGDHYECQPHAGTDCISGGTQVIYIGYWSVKVTD